MIIVGEGRIWGHVAPSHYISPPLPFSPNSRTSPTIVGMWNRYGCERKPVMGCPFTVTLKRKRTMGIPVRLFGGYRGPPIHGPLLMIS